MKIFVETERLLLRELLPTDLEGMFELDADPEVHTYFGRKPVNHIEESRDIIALVRKQYETNGTGRWAVIEKETQHFIRWSGLKFVTDSINNHINYYRFIRKHWGKGFATETAKASLHYGFDKLYLKEIYGMAETGNLSSQNVLKKVGLTYINTFTFNEHQMEWYKMLNPDSELSGYYSGLKY